MSDASFPAKWTKVLPDGFQDSADSKKSDELQTIIFKSSAAINDLEKDMENDAKLTALKEDLKDLSGGYKDTMKVEQAKVKYCLYLLKSRGVT